MRARAMRAIPMCAVPQMLMDFGRFSGRRCRLFLASAVSEFRSQVSARPGPSVFQIKHLASEYIARCGIDAFAAERRSRVSPICAGTSTRSQACPHSTATRGLKRLLERLDAAQRSRLRVPHCGRRYSHATSLCRHTRTCFETFQTNAIAALSEKLDGITARLDQLTTTRECHDQYRLYRRNWRSEQQQQYQHRCASYLTISAHGIHRISTSRLCPSATALTLRCIAIFRRDPVEALPRVLHAA